MKMIIMMMMMVMMMMGMVDERLIFCQFEFDKEEGIYKH